MRGIVLAGGSGSRLYPMAHAISKQLLPVYDKPTIYYPLSVLMLAGLREIMIISTPRDVPMIQSLLGDGADLGLSLQYKVQDQPNGIAEAFALGGDFIRDEPVALILGDNLFYGHELTLLVSQAALIEKGALMFGYHVTNPEDYGVVEFDRNFRVVSLEEKPKHPKSHWAITGLYFYDGQASSLARQLEPSARGELEITDLSRLYLERGQLEVKLLGRGIAWLDTGTPETLLSSAQFVQTIEERQGLKIACLEEIAYHKGFINLQELTLLTTKLPNCKYRKYLHDLIDDGQL